MSYAYRLLPEWSRQKQIIITWPHAHGDWRPLLSEVEPVYIEISRQISRREALLIISYDEPHSHHIRNLLASADIMQSGIAIYPAPSNDSWTRDHGPITVLDHSSKPHLLDFTFNGWGGKYPAKLDNQLTRCLHEQGAFGDLPLKAVDLVLEGGAIEVDGRGGLLTTARCLLSPLRNPDLGCQALEALFRSLFGVERTLWLENGWLAGDDTDSHIDTLARFCNPSTIVYTSCDDPLDEHYQELKAMEAELRAFLDAESKPYKLIPLPLPEARFNRTGQRLPATYTNFLIINGAVLVPAYGGSNDKKAMATLRGCFPEREIIAIDCTPLIRQRGSLHCAAMQIPDAP